MNEWTGCICRFCSERWPEAAAERARVIRAIYADPNSKVNREKERADGTVDLS